MLSRLMAVPDVNVPRIFNTITAIPIATAMPFKAVEIVVLFILFSFVFNNMPP